MNERDCKHGQLARSCNECDLEAQLAEANESIKQLEELTDRQSIHISDLAHEVDKATTEIEELQTKLHSFYTNTNHGITMQDRHFSSEEHRVYDQNFDHDACLKVSGDFESAEQKFEYARMICSVLNGYQAKLEGAEPVAWFTHDKDGWFQLEAKYKDDPDAIPLFTAPPQVEAAVEDFRRRAMEAGEELEFPYDCLVAIASLPAF